MNNLARLEPEVLSRHAISAERLVFGISSVLSQLAVLTIWWWPLM